MKAALDGRSDPSLVVHWPHRRRLRHRSGRRDCAARKCAEAAGVDGLFFTGIKICGAGQEAHCSAGDDGCRSCLAVRRRR